MEKENNKLCFYNTKTHAKEEFKTVDGSNIVRMYSCGPTVYDYAHIGNFSMYIFIDVLRKYLKLSGYKLNHVMNITDVGHLKVDDDENYDLLSSGDKMEKAAIRENLDPWEISKKYTQAFFDDMKKLKIEDPEVITKATDNINEMQIIIKKLIDNGLAYVTEKENIYLDVLKFPKYGKFSGKNTDDLQAGAGGRIDVEELMKDKRNILDSSLWITDEAHIMKWAFPSVITSGKMGYPGWHIECSAMAIRFLSSALKNNELNPDKFTTIDIHTGGEDHIFPHHEDEIAQSEGATGKEFCNFWLHRKHVLIDGQKMSKSKGNFYTVSDLENGKFGGEKFDPLDIRMCILSGHYRTQMNFTLDGLRQAKKNRETINKFYFELENNNSSENIFDISELENKFFNFLNDDLNTPGALSIVFELISKYKKEYKSENIKTFLNKFNSIFEIINENKIEEIIPEDIKNLATERWNKKINKEYKEADELRIKIENLGYKIEENKEDYKIIKI